MRTLTGLSGLGCGSMPRPSPTPSCSGHHPATSYADSAATSTPQLSPGAAVSIKIAEVIARFRGEYLLYPGEDQNGCTGGPEMFEVLKQRYGLAEFHERPPVDMSPDREA